MKGKRMWHHPPQRAVVADNIYFGDSKRDSQSGGDYAPPAYGSPAESYTAPASGGFAEIEEDGELPF